ncbi:hypothetical protein FAIPA1_30244 [Frankia sp. AiPs1]
MITSSQGADLSLRDDTLAGHSRTMPAFRTITDGPLPATSTPPHLEIHHSEPTVIIKRRPRRGRAARTRVPAGSDLTEASNARSPRASTCGNIR